MYLYEGFFLLAYKYKMASVLFVHISGCVDGECALEMKGREREREREREGGREREREGGGRVTIIAVKLSML